MNDLLEIALRACAETGSAMLEAAGLSA